MCMEQVTLVCDVPTTGLIGGTGYKVVDGFDNLGVYSLMYNCPGFPNTKHKWGRWYSAESGQPIETTRFPYGRYPRGFHLFSCIGSAVEYARFFSSCARGGIEVAQVEWRGLLALGLSKNAMPTIVAEQVMYCWPVEDSDVED